MRKSVKVSQLIANGLTLLAPADAAFARLKRSRDDKTLFSSEMETLTEADTRAKLIDPLFKYVLGWSEAEIRRETPSQKGYADYVLGSGQPWLLVEAKRSKPRFHLKCSNKARLLDLNGPHLSNDKRVKEAIAQAQGYAVSLGAKFAIVTNGDQVIAFRPYVPGKPWNHSRALVWHDWDDVFNNFSQFHALLCRDSVLAGSLFEAFEEADSVTRQLFRALEHVQAPDQEFLRNPFWDQIASVFAPLLADAPDDRSVQKEIIENCYVTSPLSDQADKALDRLLRDAPPQSLAGAQLLEAAGTKRSHFAATFERDVEGSKGGVYLLTGGVGSGKTTFLKRFALAVERRFVEEYCLWLHVDFLKAGSVSPAEVASTLKRFAFGTLRSQVRTSYPELSPRDGEGFRELFGEEIAEAGMTLLYGYARDSIEWTSRVNQLVHDLQTRDEAIFGALIRRARRKGLRCVIVLDNTDQLGEQFQEQVFLFAQELTETFKALCIVSLREERFFAAYRRGIFDAYSNRRFHLGSPDLGQVIEKRLRYGQQKIRAQAKLHPATIETDSARKIDLLLDVIIRSVTDKNANIVRMLSCVSNGDMRYALEIFREFVSSGNTDTSKILKARRTYIVPFHEFAKSSILGSRKYFRGSVSRILNVFSRSESRASSHLTICRILARLSAAVGVPSSHGEGFVETGEVLRDFRESFGSADDLVAAASELLRRGLLESEPPRALDIHQTVALRVSASGAYYWKYLVRSFAYVDLVLVDTPIIDNNLAHKLASMSSVKEMNVRFDRVRLFLDYLEESEKPELTGSRSRSGPFRDSLVKQIRDQIDKEIRVIDGKVLGARTRRHDSSARS